MIRILTIIAACLVVCAHLYAQDARHERIEWSDIWIVNADNDTLPRVLLVGDSIVPFNRESLQHLIYVTFRLIFHYSLYFWFDFKISTIVGVKRK